MNTIVIVCDTLRRDHVGAYHHNRPLNAMDNPLAPDWVVPTPHMDRLAARGTTFENAWCGSTPCMPARRDIYTGRHEFLERGWGPLEEWDRDLPTQVSGQPYQSMTLAKEQGAKVSQLITDHLCLWMKGSGNYHFGYTGCEFIRGHHWDNWVTTPGDAADFGCPQGDRHTMMERHWRNTHAIRAEKGEAGWFAPQVFTKASDWLRENHTHDDFYLHIDCFDPHEAWDPPADLLKQFSPKGYDVEGWTAHPPYKPWRETMNEELFNHYRAAYAAMVVLVDRWLGKMLDTMDDLNLWEDTVVIFTTDHGTWNGDRDRIGKLGTHCHEAQAHIPFILCHPDAGQGQRRDQLVQLVDIYPTVLSAVGRPLPESDDNRPLHGVNLLPAVADPNAPTRDHAVCGMFGRSVSITDARWILHQQPIPENKPLHWHGYQSDGFLKANLGPVIEGRRESTLHPGHDVTWLSDKQSDPWENQNLAASHPQQLAAMQQALAQTLTKLKAPKEQHTRLGLPTNA